MKYVIEANVEVTLHTPYEDDEERLEELINKYPNDYLDDVDVISVHAHKEEM